MATPMHIIANELNPNGPITTLEHDLDNNSVISSTNAIITRNNTKRPYRKVLLDFMYPRAAHYPTDLFWTDPLIPTSPIVPPRPIKQPVTINNSTPPVLPPRPIKPVIFQSTDNNTSQTLPQHDNTTITPKIPERPTQNLFINNIVKNIIAKSIADATSNTIILEQTVS